VTLTAHSNAVANFIGNSSGAGDMFQSWMGQLQQQFANNPALTLWDIITGDPAGTITVLLLLVAYVVYALAIIVFCFFYVLFGSLLYVLGPIVLAVIPISGIGQLGKAYAINLMVWNAWGILYATFGALITAIQFNRVNDVLGNGFSWIPERSTGFDDARAGEYLLRPGCRADSVHCEKNYFRRRRINRLFPRSSGNLRGWSSGRRGGRMTAGGAGAPAAAGGGASAAAGAASGSASGMGDFIRGGVSSAMSSNTSPPTPPPSSASAPHRPSGFAYRPHGPVQVLSYMAGRRLATAVAGDSKENS